MTDDAQQESRTKAGKVLLLALPLDEWHPMNREFVIDHIRAIEAEAAGVSDGSANASEGLRAALRELVDVIRVIRIDDQPELLDRLRIVVRKAVRLMDRAALAAVGTPSGEGDELLYEDADGRQMWKGRASPLERSEPPAPPCPYCGGGASEATATYGSPEFPRWLNGDRSRACGVGLHYICRGKISTLGIECSCLCECHVATPASEPTE